MDPRTTSCAASQTRASSSSTSKSSSRPPATAAVQPPHHLVHVTHFDRSEHANPSPRHVSSAVLSPTASSSAAHPLSSTSFRRDDMSTISQPAISMSSGAARNVHVRDRHASDSDDTSPVSSYPTELVGGDDMEWMSEEFMRDFTQHGDYLTEKKVLAMTKKTHVSEIKYLELQINSRQQSFGDFASFMPQLRSLKLNGSTLDSLRDIGSRLDNLKVLWIADCDLSTLDGLSHMANLTEVYAAFNNISDLNHIMWCQELRCLDLEGNKIDDIGQIGCLTLCPCLDTLTLAGNPICSRPTPSDPDPMPGYDYEATVRMHMPALKSLDDVVLRAQKPANVQRTARVRSARARPMTASARPGGIEDADRSAATAVGGRILARPRSSASNRPMSSRGFSGGDLMASASTAELLEDDDDEDDDVAIEMPNTTAPVVASAMTLGGDVIQGNLSRALRRRAGHRPGSSLATDRSIDDDRKGSPSDQAQAVSSAQEAEGATTQKATEVRSTAAAPAAAASADAAASRKKALERPISSGTPIIQPVMVDHSRQRSEVFDELRQWRDKFSEGETLLTEVQQLSPVRRDDNAVGRQQASPSAFAQAVPVHKAQVSRRLPKLPSLGGSDPMQLPPGVVPTPPRGPRPESRRLVRPLTARPSLEHVLPKRDAAGASAERRPARKPKASRGQKEPLVSASSDEQALTRQRLRGSGADQRPTTALGKKSDYVP